MPYQFGEFVSTYRDPQSVKIAETLRNRYLENLQANDQLAMAIDQMKAALPFENDIQKKKELQKELEESLNSMAELGNYEDLGKQIRLKAMTFSKKYSPIKENYDRYQAAIADLDKRYKAKEIDAEVYARAGSYITRGYKGFEVDPTTGRVVEGSMFTAPTIYNDPGITDKVIKALSIIKPDSYQNKSNKLGVGPNGEFTVTSETGVEEVPPEDVEAALNYVMADPNVRLAVEQKADMITYDVERSGQLQGAMKQYIDQYNELINQYTTDMNTKKLKKDQKNQYQTTINSLKSEVEKATLASKDPNTSYNYIKSKAMQEIVAPTKDWAMLYAYKQTKSSTLYDYDPIYMKKVDQAMKEAEAAMPVYAQTEARAIDYGGTTVAEKTQTIKNYEARIKEIDTELSNSSLDLKAKEKLNDEKRRAIAELNMQKYQIQQATVGLSMQDLSNSISPKVLQGLQALYPEIKDNAGELYSKLSYAIKNKDSQEFKDINSASGNSLTTNYYYPEDRDWLDKLADALLAGSGGEVGSSKNIYDLLRLTDEKTNNALKELKVSTVFNYGTLQAGSPKESIALTKAFDDYFIGKPINSVDLPTAYDVSAGQKVENTDDLKNYTVKDYGFDSKTNTFELLLEDKENEETPYKKVHVSGQSLGANVPIANMLQDPTVQLGQVVMREKPMTGSVDKPEIFTRPIWIDRQVTDAITGQVRTETVQGVMGIRSTGSGTPTINFSDQYGNPIFEDNGEPSTKFRDVNSSAVQAIVKTGLIKF